MSSPLAPDHECSLEFSGTHDVKANARIAEKFQKSQIAVGLHGIEDAVLGAGNAAQPALKRRFERFTGIDVKRCAELVGKLSEVEIFAE